LKEQENSTRKVYSIDTGLSNMVGFRFSRDFGKIVENIVALKLKTMCSHSPGREIYYWKNRYGDKEVDFVIKEGSKIQNLIQVCWDISNEKTKLREIKSLLKAMDEFKIKEGLIITEEYDDIKEIDNKKIVFKPLWQWLIL
jgi:predicted AAA+ superfamily ATPase